MKNILNLTLITLLLLTALGCKKSSPQKGIQGTWELRHLAGGQIAGIDPNYKKGNGDLYKFEGENYTRHYNGAITDSGTFTIEYTEEKEMNGNNKANGIMKLSPSGREYHIYLSAKKLVIFDGIIAADGVEMTYEKI